MQIRLDLEPERFSREMLDPSQLLVGPDDPKWAPGRCVMSELVVGLGGGSVVVVGPLLHPLPVQRQCPRVFDDATCLFIPVGRLETIDHKRKKNERLRPAKGQLSDEFNKRVNG